MGGAVYIDTCVIMSYVDETDPNHERAVRLVEGLGGNRFVSMLSLVELASVYSRAGLGNPSPWPCTRLELWGGELLGWTSTRS